MIDFIHDHLSRRTRIDERYTAHAAPESIEVYLNDWQTARALLSKRIEVMEQLLDRRRGEKARGEWPPPRPEPVESPAVEKIVDLMAALEESVAAAKATRARREMIAESHTEHYRHCGCLGDSAVCCVQACPCHSDPVLTDANAPDHSRPLRSE